MERKRRRMKEEEEVKESQIEETTEEFEDEEESLGSGIVLSADKLLQLIRDPNDVPDGEYLGELSRWKYVPPKEGKAGGFRVWFKVEDSDNDEPEDGWPEVDQFFRVVYENPNEGQRKGISFNMRTLSMMLLALLGELDGEKPLEEWLEEALGEQCYFTVKHDEYNGREYKNLVNFRAAD